MLAGMREAGNGPSPTCSGPARNANRMPTARRILTLGVKPEHFREVRIRVITDKLEKMPDLVDRLYKRLG